MDELDAVDRDTETRLLERACAFVNWIHANGITRKDSGAQVLPETDEGSTERLRDDLVAYLERAPDVVAIDAPAHVLRIDYVEIKPTNQGWNGEGYFLPRCSCGWVSTVGVDPWGHGDTKNAQRAAYKVALDHANEDDR